MSHIIEPPIFAVEWCRKLGAKLDTLEFLNGGINNQVFRCMAGKHKFVIKGYAAYVSKHDRFRAEIEFLSYAKQVASEFVPQLLGSDKVSRSLALESLEGEGFREGVSPSDEDIDRAVDFIRLLNVDLELAKQQVSGSAADGFLSLTEHLQNIQQRLEKMRFDNLPICLRAEAAKVMKSMKLRLEHLKERLSRMILNGQSRDIIDPSERIVSPSDFGFHNAIRTPEGVKFFDFEFAGWDDPVKAVADFDLQPRVPLKSRARPLTKALPVWNDSLVLRYNALAPILSLKWACIILSILDPDRQMRKLVHNKDHVSRPVLEEKLQLAKHFLSRN